MGSRRSGRRKRAGQSVVKKNRQRQQRIILGIVGGFVLLGIVLFAVSEFAPLEVPLPDDYEDKYANIERGVSEDGYPQLGSSNATYTIEEFSSFSCPACEAFHNSQLDGLLPYIEDGFVRVVFIPVEGFGGPGSEVTARAGYCALEQDYFWEFHDIMFYWQERVSFNERRLVEAADEVGMDADAFSDCIDSSDTDDLVNRGMSEFRDRGASSTPTVYLDGLVYSDWGTLTSELGGRITGNQ